MNSAERRLRAQIDRGVDAPTSRMQHETVGLNGLQWTLLLLAVKVGSEPRRHITRLLRVLAEIARLRRDGSPRDGAAK